MQPDLIATQADLATNPSIRSNPAFLDCHDGNPNLYTADLPPQTVPSPYIFRPSSGPRCDSPQSPVHQPGTSVEPRNPCSWAAKPPSVSSKLPQEVQSAFTPRSLPTAGHRQPLALISVLPLQNTSTQAHTIPQTTPGQYGLSSCIQGYTSLPQPAKRRDAENQDLLSGGMHCLHSTDNNHQLSSTMTEGQPKFVGIR